MRFDPFVGRRFKESVVESGIKAKWRTVAKSVLFAVMSVIGLSNCGEPGKTVREINPVLNMFCYDSLSYAVLVHQVERVSVDRDPSLSLKTMDRFYPVWVLIPDTIGIFTGTQIGKAYTTLTRKGILRSAAFPTERIEIGGGIINFQGMANLTIEGSYKVKMQPCSVCPPGCMGNPVNTSSKP